MYAHMLNYSAVVLNRQSPSFLPCNFVWEDCPLQHVIHWVIADEIIFLGDECWRTSFMLNIAPLVSKSEQSQE